MGTTADKLNKILQSKQAIKAAIEAKGVADVGDIMSLYADKIASIQSGGTETKYTGHADTVGLKAIGWTDEDIQYYQENGVNWNEEDDEYHKVPQDNIALYGVLNENNIQTYNDLIVYLPKIEITKTDCNSMFSGCKSMVAIPILDTSNVTSMNRMFYMCYSLVCIPMLDTSNTTDFGYMFNYCYSLITIPQLDLSKCTNSPSMLRGCYSLISLPNIDLNLSEDISYLLYGCYSLKNVTTLYLCDNVSNQSSFLDNSVSLVNIQIKNLKKVFKLLSPFLSKESLLYMIQNAAPTSAITITLHSNVYDKYIEDPDILSALEAQPNITLAK